MSFYFLIYSMLELEKTYLIKNIPSWLSHLVCKDIVDIYVPFESEHAHLRIRKHGEVMSIVKKVLTCPGDLSSMDESVIFLDVQEFLALQKVSGKRIHKHRYYLPYNWLTIEIDVFQDELQWLIMADVEFPDETTKQHFVMPDFCLCEVTQEKMFAWWLLCGKTYTDISPKLYHLWYQKLFVV